MKKRAKLILKHQEVLLVNKTQSYLLINFIKIMMTNLPLHKARKCERLVH